MLRRREQPPSLSQKAAGPRGQGAGREDQVAVGLQTGIGELQRATRIGQVLDDVQRDDCAERAMSSCELIIELSRVRGQATLAAELDRLPVDFDSYRLITRCPSLLEKKTKSAANFEHLSLDLEPRKVSQKVPELRANNPLRAFVIRISVSVPALEIVEAIDGRGVERAAYLSRRDPALQTTPDRVAGYGK